MIAFGAPQLLGAMTRRIVVGLWHFCPDTRSAAILDRRSTRWLACGGLAALISAGGGCSDDSAANDSAIPPKRDAAVADGSASDGSGDGAGDAGSADARKRLDEWRVVSGEQPSLLDHTLTLLDDGRVLVVGGYIAPAGQASHGLAAIYLYDPAKNKLSRAGQLRQGRGQHIAVRLADGRVLIAGGRSKSSASGRLKSSEIFDPTKSGQAALSAGPDLPETRVASGPQEAVRLKNGNVMWPGGYGGTSGDNQASIMLYDAKRNRWQLLGTPMKSPRGGHTVTLLDSGKVLVAGGYDGKKWLDTLEVIESDGSRVRLLSTKLSKPRSGHSAIKLRGGKVLFVGGFCGGSCTLSEDELYDVTTDKSTRIAHPGGTPVRQAAAPMADNEGLVVGGGASDRSKALGYDPTSNAWSALAKLKFGRSDARAIRLRDGTVFVIGGETGSPNPVGPFVTRSERYYP